MEKNQPNEEVIDPALEKAQKSMGNRVDSDETPVDETPEEPVKDPIVESKADEDDEDDEPVDEPKDDEPSGRKSRPEKYIPMAKYLDEKNQWKNDKEEKEALTKRIEELEALASKPDNKATDNKISEFAEKYGMDEDIVKDLVGLAKADLLPPETLEKIEKASQIAQRTEDDALFEREFQAEAIPVIEQKYPNATKEQIKQAKIFLDKISHSKDFHDKELDYVIYKNSENLDLILKTNEKPEGKKGMDGGRNGAGAKVTLSAKDFEGSTADFSRLQELDQADRGPIINDMSADAYRRYISWVGQNAGGVEVMRNGKKVNLK